MHSPGVREREREKKKKRVCFLCVFSQMKVSQERSRVGTMC